jgi:SnoaL-like domain
MVVSIYFRARVAGRRVEGAGQPFGNRPRASRVLVSGGTLQDERVVKLRGESPFEPPLTRSSEMSGTRSMQPGGEKLMNDLQPPCADRVTAIDSVDAILWRRSTTETYEDRCQYALDLVCLYLQHETAQRIDQCLRLCAFDAVWEAPLREVSFTGARAIGANYQRVFRNVRDLRHVSLEQFATAERVFTDSLVSFTIVGDAFDNCPLPLGAHARVRRLNTFHIADGLIRRATGYEIWEQYDA